MRRERAARESSAILEQARSAADAERVRAATERRSRARQDTQSVRDGARGEAERIDGMRDAAIDELVAEVLACVRRTGR